MKKTICAFVAFWFVFMAYGGTVTIVGGAGQVFVGTEVRFQFTPAGAEAGNCNWDFGDGQTENMRAGEIRHTFREAGNYRVRCTSISATAAPDEGEIMVNVVDNRRVNPQGGQFRVGKRVNFQAENFVDNTLRWDFGDGTVENGPRNHHHAFQNPGNFTVRAFDFGGSSPTAISCLVAVEPDNRQLTASPNAPRANQVVSFTAQNFPAPNLRWDFGDGTVENGGLNVNHVYRQPGNFNVFAWESAESAESAVKMQLNVAPDNRQIQVVPLPARANQTVRFSLLNFPGADLKWNFGDGKVENDGSAISHMYVNAGNFQVQAWDAGEAPESGVKISVNVQPDNRIVNITNPPELFQGAEVSFETHNFNGANLKWELGDGTVERGGIKNKHRYMQPGNFLLKVVEGDGANSLPVEKRIQIMNDNRDLAVKSSVIFANSEFEIEALNFRGSSVNWDFGDGTVLPGSRLMKHRFTRSGSFRIRAIDFGGRDGKTIEKNFMVENDLRELVLPGEIIEGEGTDLQLKNSVPGNFTWKFSDGDTRSGPGLKGKAFRFAGSQKITVSDPTGKFPPLEKMVQVVPDNRALRTSAQFALPKEPVTFSAVNFRGPSVRWDFGDGSVKENGALQENHVYASLGRFKVAAVDFSGRGSKVFSQEVVVAEMTPGFEIKSLEFVFENGKYYRVLAKNSPAPAYQLQIKAKGRGIINGQFMLDNLSLGLFQIILSENQIGQLPRNQMVALPVIDQGLHELTFKFTNYSFNEKVPILKYFVSLAGVIQIVSPLPGSSAAQAKKIPLRWDLAKKKAKFEITVSTQPIQFLNDRQIEWLAAGEGEEYLLDTAAYKPGSWIYWQVRQVGETGQVLTTSEISSFKLGK